MHFKEVEKATLIDRTVETDAERESPSRNSPEQPADGGSNDTTTDDATAETVADGLDGMINNDEEVISDETRAAGEDEREQTDLSEVDLGKGQSRTARTPAVPHRSDR